MTHANIDRLRAIKTLPQLVAYLRDELDWPIHSDDTEEITFSYEAKELGLDEQAAVRIKEIKQLRPLASGQPWGIFFINFEKKRLPVVVMRRILRSLTLRKRESANKAEQQAWQTHDLLFISSYGDDDDRAVSFAHFSENPGSNLAELRVLGWDDDDTPLHADYVVSMLREKLRWDDSVAADPAAWRARWAEAFVIRHRHVITTSEELAEALAVLARRLRSRIRSILKMEAGDGQIRTLQRAFQIGLIHDLDDEGFADMFAQTVTYGLFSVSVRRTFPGEGTAVVKDDVPNLIFTSPFLKDMLGVFLGVKSYRGKIDFDELGVSDVTDLLTSKDTRMDAILRDFGNRTRGEDPVIHFYEHFLSAYNKQLKIQRGVFYTPQPVVSYIVRSVHELLQTEFGLADGLADTTTWGQMLKKHPGLKLPPLTDEPGEKRTISPDEPFVQILDPATGTATFLVEVIDVIYNHLKAKWAKSGLAAMPKLPISDLRSPNFESFWNAYVPKTLLPRLHAFELMMAPYAIAHMKIGLKLAETGYRFGTEERARIYLTNALEPKVKQLPQIGFDALAHEAAAVNEIKWYKRFTVVIGNPPYSEKSKNEGAWINGLMERYKTTIRSEEAQIKTVSNDYVKFLCFIHHTAHLTDKSIVGVITSNGYLDGRLFRDLRNAWLASFARTDVLNLHGSGRRGDAISEDENVFDILQGVSIAVARRELGTPPHEVRYTEMVGRRSEKYDRLSTESVIQGSLLSPRAPLFLFTPSTAAETSIPTWPLSEIFGTGNPGKDRNKTYAGGFKTRQDSFTVAFDEQTLRERIVELADSSIRESQLREAYGLCSTAHFEFDKARRAARSGILARGIRRVRYRPFDDRAMIWSREVLCEPQTEVTRHLLRPNLCLATSRVVKDDAFRHVAVARGPVEVISLSNSTSTNAYMFPLYRYESGQLWGGGESEESRIVNLSRQFVAEMTRATGLTWEEGELGSENRDVVTPEGIFYYLYAVLHSPGYRAMFADELRRDFPPIPLPCGQSLFRVLARLGGELTALHLLESPRLAQPLTEFIGGRNPEVEKVSWTRDTVWVDKAQTTGFRGVREPVWDFHIGGYQVCEKWLKDRKGRTLTKDDIAHYHKIVVALSETIRLMKEIDEVIEKHGGWPGAFAVAASATPTTAAADQPPAAPPEDLGIRTEDELPLS